MTVTTSVLIHTAMLGAVAAGPLIAGTAMPPAMARISAFVAPDQLPEVAPPPQPVPAPAQAPDSAINPNAAPVEPPRDIPDTEAERPPSAPGPAVPGALRLPTGTGGGAGLNIPGGTATIAAPPAPPAREGPRRVGGTIRAPERVDYVAPVYPTLAQSARVEGMVILEAVIDEQGRVTNLRVLKSVPLLDDAARQAVMQWRYTPTLLNGTPIAVIMNVTVRFTLR